MGINFFYFIRGKKKFFYVVNFFLKNWTFFGSWAKLELHIVVRSWVSLGNTPFRGGVFEATESISTTSIVMKFSHGLWSLWTTKSPLGNHIFGEFFWTLFYETFYGEQSLFYGICCANRRKVLFFAISQKKIEKSHILDDFT